MFCVLSSAFATGVLTTRYPFTLYGIPPEFIAGSAGELLVAFGYVPVEFAEYAAGISDGLLAAMLTKQGQWVGNKWTEWSNEQAAANQTQAAAA